MKRILLRAPLLTCSGYGTHARQIFRYLMTCPDVEVTCHCLYWGMTSWIVDHNFENGLAKEIMKRASSPDDNEKKFDVSIQVQLPNEWDPNIANVNIGVSAFVESDVCNYKWVELCDPMDMIIVPSHFTKGVIENSGETTTPVRVIGESFYEDILHLDIGDKKSIDPIINVDTDFNFLLLGQLTGNHPENDRKNMFNTIKWICEEFKDKPDVGIVIKTNSGKGTTIDKTLTENILKRLLGEVRLGPFPKVHFIHGLMSPVELAKLYTHPKIKALVSLTRGEGFGLPLLEAAASGLPIITTSWSGHLDFLGLGKYIGVDYDLVEIPPSRVDNQIWIAGAKWAEVSEEDTKKKLTKFYNSSFKPQEWANDLKEKVKIKFSQEAINRDYKNVLGDILA